VGLTNRTLSFLRPFTTETSYKGCPTVTILLLYEPEFITVLLKLICKDAVLNVGHVTVGITDGSIDGETDGDTDGLTDGATDGETEGDTDGLTDGAIDRETDGTTDGLTDGSTDGETDGWMQLKVMLLKKP
jgi:hypothetical protein